MALEAIGIIGLGFVLSTTVTGWEMAPWLFLYGMGVGFATAQLTGVILSEVPVAESGQASAVQSTSRQLGAAIGTAIIGATLIFGLGTVAGQLEDRGVPAEQAAQVSDAVASSAGQAIPGLADAARRRRPRRGRLGRLRRCDQARGLGRRRVRLRAGCS